MTVKLYRKRPVTIEAIQYTHSGDAKNVQAVSEFTMTHNEWPVSQFIIINDEDRDQKLWGKEITAAVFDDLHSTWVGVKDGQFIIKGLQGEFYPHDEALFPEAYEEVWG